MLLLNDGIFRDKPWKIENSVQVKVINKTMERPLQKMTESDHHLHLTKKVFFLKKRHGDYFAAYCIVFTHSPGNKNNHKSHSIRKLN